ncbi:hypothetical protein PFISCL1PPCAC_15299, partial [Pristionchus fissidentatus]
TKSTLISHFNGNLSSPIKEEEAILLHSCTASYDLLTHLITDPNDIILTPSPFYARVRSDCGERSQCRIEAVPLDPFNPTLIVSDYQREIDRWTAEGIPVRGIIVMNPHNPLGNIVSKEELIELCEWAMSNNLFIIVDEILAGTIYSQEKFTNFPSILDLLNQLSKPDLIVWMSSLSKDIGIPGVRSSLCVIPSSPLRRALIRLESLTAVPAPDQLIVKHLLNDQNWISCLLSLSRSRLHSHSKFVVDSLNSIGISAVSPQAGMTLMADFSKFLSDQSLSAEDELHLRMVNGGVILTKGGPTHAASPGWFRIAFGVPKEELEIGIERIIKILVPGETLNCKLNNE